MKILLIPSSDWISHPIPSRLHFIFERLAKKHQVHVLRYPIPLWSPHRNTSVIVHNAKGLPLRDLSLYYVLNAPRHTDLIRNILKANKIDVIVFANILTGAESTTLGKITDTPIICDYLDHFPESASAYYNNPIIKNVVEKSVLCLTKFNVLNADHVVTVTDSLLAWLRSIGISKSSLIPNGVEQKSFQPEDRDVARNKLAHKEIQDKFVITYTGSVENWYDLDVVARATGMLNSMGVPSIFQVVGGHLVNYASNNFIGYEKNVFKVGMVNYSKVSTYVNSSDICVLPLKNMAKNLARPLKLFEYFSCKKPVLSLPNPQVEREFGDAITVFHNEAELAKIAYAASRGEHDFTKKLEKGLKYAEENSWDKFALDYERLLNSIITDHSTKH